jgi:chromosome segregation ATPase
MTRILRLSVLTIGLLGTLSCVAMMIGSWVVSAKLSATTQNVFSQIDGTLSDLRERVPQAKERLEAAKITVEDIEYSLRELTKQELGNQLSEQLKLPERTERLDSAAEHADQWLEMSETTLKLVQQILSASRPNESSQSESLDALLHEIATLRKQLSEIEDFANIIQERITPGGDEKPIRERIEQAIQLGVRTAATLGLIQSGLEALDRKVSQVQLDVREMENSTLRSVGVLALVADENVVAHLDFSLPALRFRQGPKRYTSK